MPRTSSSALVARVRDDIVGCVLAPGSRLRLRELSERYGTGVNPLREALSRLAMSGLVVVEDQKGFRVAAVSPEGLADLTCTRQQIECLALRAAITRGDLAWEGGIVAASHQLGRIPMGMEHGAEQVNDAWERAHLQFHLSLIAACGSEWLLHFHQLLASQALRYRRLAMLNRKASRRDIAAEHDELAAATLARDADAACALMTAHFQRTTEIVMRANTPAAGS